MHGPRWYPTVVAVFSSALIVSNIIAVKFIDLFGLNLPAGVVLFPIVYIVGDILTEVYGYARARQAIWIGFGCNLLAVGSIWVAGRLPAAAFWNAGSYPGPLEAGQAYQAILGFSARLIGASFLAYLVGEFLNAFVLAKLKLATEGRMLWLRTIGSTLVGQGADSAVFITAAFWGILPTEALGSAVLAQWLVKSGYEALATPLTYLVVNALKRVEGAEIFDRTTDFRPVAF